jgi:DNA (cytosine-5)-methyltransferase 1
MTTATNPALTCIDLFAGCGGLSLGLEQAGFRPLLFSELNASAAKTYLANRKDFEVLGYGDIHALTNAKLKKHLADWKLRGIEEVDLVCGGPPCQGYSGIGHRRSYSVAREEVPSNHLFEQMIRVIKAVRPRIFLFENVRGLLNGRWTPEGEKGEIWRDVHAAFNRIPGYTVRWRLVQAKEYAVPQNRPRVLLVGIRNDVLSFEPTHSEDAVKAGFLPAPDTTNPAPNLSDVWGDLLDPLYMPQQEQTETYPSAALCAFQREMREVTGTKRGARVRHHEYSKHSTKIVEKFQHMLTHNGEIPAGSKTKKFAQRLLRAEWGKDGPNITVTSLPDDFVHYAQPRSLTVREWARLQTFPDHYEFMGPRTTGGTRRAGIPTEGVWDREVPQYTQIGNAVPVRLAKAVGLHFRNLLQVRP